MDQPDTSHVQLLGPAQVRELAEELDVSPTKKLGQNFVHDPNTVRKIVAAAEVGPDDQVVEVGPGLGSLTLALLDVVRGVTAVEIDARLAAKLPSTVEERASAVAARLAVIEQDALKITRQDFVDAGQPMPTALVANLPYNVSVPVLLHLLHQFSSITRVLVMVQLEVADRLAAKPGSKIYGVPSVKAGFYGTVTRAATIGKNVFWPAPKIDSGLVRIDRFDPQTAPWDVDDQQLKKTVFEIADAAFLQRRKTLRAALSGYCGGGQQAEDVLVAAGIDPKERGEKLATADYVRLARVVLERSAGGADAGENTRDAGGADAVEGASGLGNAGENTRGTGGADAAEGASGLGNAGENTRGTGGADAGEGASGLGNASPEEAQR